MNKITTLERFRYSNVWGLMSTPVKKKDDLKSYLKDRFNSEFSNLSGVYNFTQTENAITFIFTMKRSSSETARHCKINVDTFGRFYGYKVVIGR